MNIITQLEAGQFSQKTVEPITLGFQIAHLLRISPETTMVHMRRFSVFRISLPSRISLRKCTPKFGGSRMTSPSRSALTDLVGDKALNDLSL